MKKLFALSLLAPATLGLAACGEKVVDDASNVEMITNETMDVVNDEALESAPLEMNTTATNETADPVDQAADAAKEAARAAAEAAANSN